MFTEWIHRFLFRRLKWPAEIWFIRHGQSAYNELRDTKMQDPLYREFLQAFRDDYTSARCVELAHILWKKYRLTVGDWNTPLTQEGLQQAHITGRHLMDHIHLPDILLVSPHNRTQDTLEQIMKGWPALRKVPVIIEPRLHEQDHGLATIYNDSRIFEALNPEQKLLKESAGPYWYRYPQGQNIYDTVEQQRSLIGTLVRDYSGKKVGCITHNRTILSFLGAIQRWDQHQYIEWEENMSPINCGLTVFRGNPLAGKKGRLELVQYNKRLY